jgi:hypothetical protein
MSMGWDYITELQWPTGIVVHAVGDIWVCEPLWNDIDGRKLKNLVKNLSQCHFVHHKSHTYWPRHEPGLLLWETGDWPPESFNGLVVHTVQILVCCYRRDNYDVLSKNFFLYFVNVIAAVFDCKLKFIHYHILQHLTLVGVWNRIFPVYNVRKETTLGAYISSHRCAAIVGWLCTEPYCVIIKIVLGQN